jgi:polyribonucleotide nucleotidyltransferase
MQRKIFTTDFGRKTLQAEFNNLTEQANGSVLLTYGETVILVTAVMGKEDNFNLSYFPLSVEFEEKFYAAGEILGSRFVRKEGRPSDEAVLSARIVDRTIRPLFSSALRTEVQVVVTVLAIGEDDPDVLAVIGASLALGVSDIPWDGPVASIRIGRKRADKSLIINPTYTEREVDSLDLEVLACGKAGKINMIETAAYEVSEADIVAVLTTATNAHRDLELFQQKIIAEIGKAKRPLKPTLVPEALTAFYTEAYQAQLIAALFSDRVGKEHLYELKDSFVKAASELVVPQDKKVAGAYFEAQLDHELHRGAVELGKRADGRAFDEVRSLYAQAGGISPVLHGSGIFYRGSTHIFSALTLGGPDAAQMIETMEERSMKKNFMHHYNFPPFSVGETGRVGGFNRRMIGHGALAEKALAPVIPPKEKFPYTIRLVSETMSSNGSSSMGSVCASVLALMDGGVPITRPVAGIASGVMFYNGSYQLLTDIQGPEDEFGDMDFKVAGTSVGITAIQMDVKVAGITIEVLKEALEKARLARLHILAVLLEELPEPRPAISPRAPQIITLSILPEQIGLVIGSGGKTINGIKEESGVEEITIEDDGKIYISGKNDSAKQAETKIRALTKRYALGDRVEVTITKLADFGAFARLDAYNEGLIHISEIAPSRIETLEGLFTIGEVIPVLVSKLDNGKIGLSIKQVDPDFITKRTHKTI